VKIINADEGYLVS